MPPVKTLSSCTTDEAEDMPVMNWKYTHGRDRSAVLRNDALQNPRYYQMSSYITSTSVWSPDDKDERVKLIQRAQWLRAAILGANDGLLSTTALMLGVGAAKDDQGLMIVSGLAGALAGACSMAVGEFVSVSTQRDIERTTNSMYAEAELSRKTDPDDPVKTQESIPADGDSVISSQVGATSRASRVFSSPRSPFMKVVARDARENIPAQESREAEDAEDTLPSPCKAAGASGLAFLCGSLVPILSAMVFSHSKIIRIVGVVVVASVALVVFGGAGARLGGSPVKVSAMRVLVGGWVAMAVTYALLMPLDRDEDGEKDSRT